MIVTLTGKRQPPRLYKGKHRVRTWKTENQNKRRLKARKEEGHTPSEKLWRNQETHFSQLKRSAASNLTDETAWGLTGDNWIWQQASVVFQKSFKWGEDQQKDSGDLETKWGEEWRIKRTGMIAPSHCLILFQKANHLLRLPIPKFKGSNPRCKV